MKVRRYLLNKQQHSNRTQDRVSLEPVTRPFYAKHDNTRNLTPTTLG
jgi:hypothetical protein